jgi:hypothetical protein
MFRQDRTNPSTAVSNWKGRRDSKKGHPNTAVSTWLNGGLFGGALTYETTGSPTVRTVGIYTTLEYTGTGTFVILSNPAALTFDLLVVAGGASGNTGYMTAGSSQHTGGGGGAGGMRVLTGQTLSVASHTVTVFAGGAAPAYGATSWGADGSGGTAITGHTVVGGGLGGNSSHYGTHTGPNVGGSGGGGGPVEFGSTQAGAAGTTDEGSAGGSGFGWYSYRYDSGGGGGKGGTGYDAALTTNMGHGGDGGTALSNDYATGSGIDYSGGGGGGGYYYDDPAVSTQGGEGGANAGRGGSYKNHHNGIGPGIVATAGTANRGGGGGGGGHLDYSLGRTAGNGGSGTVVIRWVTP